MPRICGTGYRFHVEGKKMNPQFRARISERITCNIDVNAGDTLNTYPARIVDLSRHGAQVFCDTPYEPGKTIHIDLEGEFTWATVAWAEVDRMGIKFLMPLNDTSRLGKKLQQLQKPQRPAFAPQARVGGFGRRRVAA